MKNNLPKVQDYAFATSGIALQILESNYYGTINKFKRKITSDLKKNTTLDDESKKILINFNQEIKCFYIDIFLMFLKSHYVISSTDEIETKQYTEEFDDLYNFVIFNKRLYLEYSPFIRSEIMQGNKIKAMNLKNHFVYIINELKLDLLVTFFIEIHKTPIDKIFVYLIDEFEKDTNFPEQINQPEPEPLDLSDTSASKGNTIIIIKEKYGEMFSNNGFKLFEHILSEYVKPKNKSGRYEDLSYYYRCLFEDKFIHQKPEPFRFWFIKEYKDEFSKIKTKTQSTHPQRKKNYSTALDWFKLQNE